MPPRGKTHRDFASGLCSQGASSRKGTICYIWKQKQVQLDSLRLSYGQAQLGSVKGRLSQLGLIKAVQISQLGSLGLACHTPPPPFSTCCQASPLVAFQGCRPMSGVGATLHYTLLLLLLWSPNLDVQPLPLPALVACGVFLASKIPPGLRV